MQKRGQPTIYAKKYARKDNKEKYESVWFSIEPDAGKRLEICLSGVGSNQKPALAV